MKDRRSLELFGIWFGYLVGTTLWILISVSGTTDSLAGRLHVRGYGVHLRRGHEGSASNSGPRSCAELLIDCEEGRTLRTVLVGMLREGDRNA